jgi:hypothetical protein
MGLLDVLQGMSNGPRGQTQATSQGGGLCLPSPLGFSHCSPTRPSSEAALSRRGPPAAEHRLLLTAAPLGAGWAAAWCIGRRNCRRSPELANRLQRPGPGRRLMAEQRP